MRSKHTLDRTKKPKAPSPLMVRLDQKSKACLMRAAKLRGISVSDYVRMVVVTQARREIREDRDGIISLTPEEQLAFWNALNETPVLTESQRQLGAIMRGEL
jgi:uncharacterized protein (DUF1778 family)